MITFFMKIHLRHPSKDIEITGPKYVRELMKELHLNPEAYLVIRHDDLVTDDEVLKDSDTIEIRPVISGG
jgi:sulfur carrier protein